jgi:hypothetical protein
MAQYHGYSISDIEGMIPFERDIFVDKIREYESKLKEEIERS